jgi:hypothetical protein
MTDEFVTKLETGATVRIKDGIIHVHIPYTFKKRGGRKQIIHPDQPEPQSPLVTQIVRAFKWQKMLDEGKYGSVKELADSIGLDSSYVATTIRFTLLAPDIVEAILDGKEPSGISVTKLRKITSSVVWDEQRERLFDQAS